MSFGRTDKQQQEKNEEAKVKWANRNAEPKAQLNISNELKIGNDVARVSDDDGGVETEKVPETVQIVKSIFIVATPIRKH